MSQFFTNSGQSSEASASASVLPVNIQLIRHIGGPLAGLLLCRLAHQALKGAPWVGSYSVIQCVRYLMGQPLYCSAAVAGMWEERGYGDGPTPYV